MTLRARLSLSATLSTLLALLLFGTLAYVVFVRQQDASLRAVLRQDLERVAALLAEPRVGESFTRSNSDAFILQFVTADGLVVTWWGEPDPLPRVTSVQRVLLEDRPYLVSSAEWPSASGTIRLAHDISGAELTRRRLLQILLASGLLAGFGAMIVSLVMTRRSLEPLRAVSEQARGIDPACPQTISYHGPEDEIDHLTRALNGALEAIRGRQTSERAFLTEIAHELAGPLTLVSYYLGDAQKENGSDRRLRAAAESARELLRTSQDLLVLARGELERPLQPEVIDLSQLLERVVDEYPGVELEEAPVREVVGDRDRLAQVFRNLIRNGIQAAGAASKVSIRLRDEKEQELVEVVDAGPGMSEETLARAFERLYSGGRGVGVGLTIAKSIVERHGGSIEVSSLLGQGSVFVVRLPSLASQLVEQEGELQA